jgi:hypothetical protein
MQVGDTGPAESTWQGNLQRVWSSFSGLAGQVGTECFSENFKNFDMGYENQRPVYKKNVFEILSGFLNSQKVFIVFSLQKWLMGYKKCVFSYGFQKCKFDLSKKCSQKKFEPKKSRKNPFFGQNFLCAHKGQMYIFEISIKRRIFL